MAIPKCLSHATRRALLTGLRTALAACLAYALALTISLPEPFWAALSALIVARAQPGAALMAGRNRAYGTLAGVLWALFVIFLNQGKLPALALMALCLTPLAILAARYAQFRAGLVAALIVLAPSVHSPVGAALMRVAALAIGAGMALVLVWLAFPYPARRAAFLLACRLRAAFLHTMAQLYGKNKPAFDRLERQMAEDMFNLNKLRQVAPLEKDELTPRIYAQIERTHTSHALLLRTLAELINNAGKNQLTPEARQNLAGLFSLSRHGSAGFQYGVWLERLAEQKPEQAYAFKLFLQDLKTLDRLLNKIKPAAALDEAGQT